MSPLEVELNLASGTQLHHNNWNGKQVAEALRISASTVSRSLSLLDLPSEIQQQIEEGKLAARSAYELSKLPTQSAQLEIASSEKNLTHKQANSAVRQRKGKPAPKPKGFQQTFFADNDLKVTVSGAKKTTYDHVEFALVQVLDEIRLYIANGRSVL